MTQSRYRAALAAQMILLVYFEACVLVPLGAWNDQPGMEKAFSPSKVILGGTIAGAQGLLLIGTIWRVRVLLWLGLIGDSVWLVLHGTSLWAPYIRGASPEYARTGTTKAIQSITHFDFGTYVLNLVTLSYTCNSRWTMNNHDGA